MRMRRAPGEPTVPSCVAACVLAKTLVRAASADDFFFAVRPASRRPGLRDLAPSSVARITMLLIFSLSLATLCTGGVTGANYSE